VRYTGGGAAALEKSGIMRLHPHAMRLLPLLLPILLLPMGREAFGQPQCTPSPQLVNAFPSPGTRIREMAVVGSTLFLSVEDGANGYGLWKLEEGQAPVRLGPLAGSPPNVFNLSKLTAVGQRLFFVIQVETDNQLWATDGAHTGISRVGTRAFPGNSVIDLGELTALGASLYLRGLDGGGELRLWWSDGTDVRIVTDNAGNPVKDPSRPVAMGQKLFFAANDSQAGTELWVIESAGGAARGLKDLWPGSQSSNPASLTVMGGKLYFTATTPAQDASLWVSDGSEAGTYVVAGPATLGSPHGTPGELTAVGDKLFFYMDQQTESGDELWVSDGTEANTRIVKEIQPNVNGGSPRGLTAVGNMLFFIANDGTSGREPWMSDSTAAGTFMVEEFVAGSVDALETPELKAGPGVLLLSIFEADSGKELWSASRAGVVQLTDIVAGPESSTPHALTIVGGRLYFAAGRTGEDDDLYWLPLNQVDCHNPSVTCPGPLEIEAVSPMGSLVFLPPPVQMSDDSFTPLTVSYSPGALALFAVDNSTPATITVRDKAGREGTCSVTVNVQDRRGPELVCPAGLTVEATGPDGANASYPVEAWDAVSGVSSVNATPPSGSRFRLGQEAQVMVTAEDGKGNPTTCEFSVTVKDTQPPKLTCPRDIVHVATSAEPIPVTYAPLQLEDATGARLLESTEHPSGSLFGLGRTPVTLEAEDAVGHRSECTFSVYVVDPVAPTITCPGPQQAVATGPEGAVVAFPEASAEDALGPPTLRYSAEPGSTFPVGETTVTATAADSEGNEASCSFTVTVTRSGQEVPASGCACRAGSASASVYWLLLALAPLWARRRSGRLAR
jgi:ELWxxDGT repeat protein